MPLSLYRRHRQECEANRPEESRSGEFEERKKGWKRCSCLIFASGTLGGKFSRRYTGKSDWDEAKSVAADWEQADVWEGQGARPEPPATKTEAETRVSLERAIQPSLPNSRKASQPTRRRNTGCCSQS
jgi:hypothetical protein